MTNNAPVSRRQVEKNRYGLKNKQKPTTKKTNKQQQKNNGKPARKNNVQKQRDQERKKKKCHVTVAMSKISFHRQDHDSINFRRFGVAFYFQDALI